MQPNAPKLLEDIRDAARFVLDETASETMLSYTGNRRLRQLVERNFEIMGEALRRLHRADKATAERITDYTQVIAFRNALIHGYDEIDHARVWRVIAGSLPVLEAEVVHLLAEADSDTENRG